MNTVLRALLILLFFASCQEAAKIPDYLLRRNMTPEQYKAQIKSEKKKQAELDLPYRSLSADKKIESLSFATGADVAPTQSTWGSIEKNKPDLNLLLSETGVSPQASEYRSVREKVPFMAIWNNETPEITPKSKNDFLKNWPYIKNLIGARQTGLYHAMLFGQKKDIVHVLMLDASHDRPDAQHILSEEQWSWLESELKKTAAITIAVSAKSVIAGEKQAANWASVPSERKRFFNLVKKTKTKNLILLTPDEEVSSINKSNDIIEISVRAAQPLKPKPAADAPPTETKYAEFGMIHIDWYKRQAMLEVRTIQDKNLKAMEISF